MTSLPDRQQFVSWFEEAVTAGARRHKACSELGITLRTLQRWTADGTVAADRRPEAVRARPANALNKDEREAIVKLCNSPQYASLPPSQIVPRLADHGIYVASESTMYRVLRAAGQQHRRGRSQPPRRHPAPTTYVATAPLQVLSWDITYLPSRVRGQFFYLYLIEDIFSRKAVGWEVYASECGGHAATLLQRTLLSERCLHQPLVLHSDNGAPMKSATLLGKMYELGITPSRSRPRVSNDNAYSESLFRTLKYCPQWPRGGFADLDAARHWVRDFVRWYNHEHRHSRIRFVTPAERHCGQDKQVLAKRAALYQEVRLRHPERWSGKTRNWTPVAAVTLNPERENRLLNMAA